MWNEEQIPQQLKDASIVHIYKRKGNHQSCDRGISLLSIAGNILPHVLLNCLLQHLEQGLLQESQCSFHAERGTMDIIFAACQLQEKSQKQYSNLFMTFVDLTKAFNTVSREGLWQTMEKFGCASKFITIVWQFHDNMMVKVVDDGDESEAFPVTNGINKAAFLPSSHTKKTNVMYQPAQGKSYQEPHITVKGQNLHVVDNFTYLGNKLSRSVNIDTDVNNRITKASTALGDSKSWNELASAVSKHSCRKPKPESSSAWLLMMAVFCPRPGMCELNRGHRCLHLYQFDEKSNASPNLSASREHLISHPRNITEFPSKEKNPTGPQRSTAGLMETKKKSGSGIGRIFSLSLSDAISNKNTTHRNKDRSSGASAHSSPENDKLHLKVLEEVHHCRQQLRHQRLRQLRVFPIYQSLTEIVIMTCVHPIRIILVTVSIQPSKNTASLEQRQGQIVTYRNLRGFGLHSRPASRPSSQPPSRPPSSLDNFCRDLRPQYLSPTQSEKWNFTGDRINESNGAHEKETVTVPSYSRHPFVSRSEAEKWDSQQNFTGERSADSGAGHEKETVTVPSFSRDPFVSPSQAEKLDSEQYFTWDRSVQEERKEGPPYENYPSEQHSYPDCRDLSPFQRARMLHHDPSPDWNLKPQWSLPLPQCPPPPPPPHHPPNYMCPMPRESASQTSCSLPTTPSEPGHLDSSFDTRESYDASSSEQEEAVRGEGVSAKRKRSALSDVGYDKFVAAQKERYLQMYKDSGSEDPDSSSLPSSKQSLQTKTSNDEEEKNSTGSGVIPKCQESSTKNVFHSLYRRAIPISCRDRNRRSCPPAVESTPAVSSEQGSPCDKKPWAPDGLMPAAGLSYMQTVTSPGAWWQQASQPNCVPVGDEDFPSLSATASFVSQHAPLGSGTPTISENSFSKDNVSFSGAKDDGSCENFYRKKAQDEFRGGRWGMSRYASRLLNDNRLSGGKKWGKEAREAFSKPYQTSFVDTHCHLDFLFNREPYSGTYASYREKNKNTFPKNYEACVAVFCRPKSFVNRSKWKPIVEEPGVWMAMGCHPKNATEYTEWTEEGLKQALKHEKTVALGEIGLDYSKHHGQFSAQQKDVFIRQIRIALDMNLPLVIHCREAEDDCLEILEKHVPADYKIHCHCFTSNYESATKWTSRFKNLFIGLTPLITFRSAVGTHEVARLLPLNRLLLETDAPYFLPSGFEWEGLSLSHPGMALMVAIRVAELRGIQVEEVLVQVRRNTQDMYGI
ncbi:uncharacterized protein LOC143300022 [Babylonia areolata]|uniref:uncharacterized protein LOC143300022 n=1 Tax=Babylonia areolata TaxID=304850 RepID=UPI003FD56816